MRYFIIASHHKLAYGLKDTLDFLTNKNKPIFEISAYVDPSITIDEQIEQIMEKIDVEKDELIMMSDMIGGSVTQKLYRFISDHTHLITGVSLPLALSLVLYPDNKPLTGTDIKRLITEAMKQMIYVDDYQFTSSIDDE